MMPAGVQLAHKPQREMAPATSAQGQDEQHNQKAWSTGP
jgi:hypothetical protein